MSLHVKESSSVASITTRPKVKVWYSDSYTEMKIPVEEFQRALCVIQAMGPRGTDTSLIMFSLSRNYSNTGTVVSMISNPLNLNLHTSLDIGYGDQQYFRISVSNGEVAWSHWELLTIDMSLNDYIMAGTDGSEF